jgi:hypothetical protein
MKIKGRKIEGPNVVTIVIPRDNAPNIVFRAQGVLDMEEFEKLCPRPQPPEMLQRGIGKVQNIEDPGYKQEVKEWGKKNLSWRVLKSLSATDGLEWELVKMHDSNTWNLWEEELKQSGFSDIELQRILTGVMDANSLSEEKVEIARQRFLLDQQADNGTTTSLTDALKSTLSGEPAND